MDKMIEYTYSIFGYNYCIREEGEFKEFVIFSDKDPHEFRYGPQCLLVYRPIEDEN